MDSAAEYIQDLIKEMGYSYEVIEFLESTKTAGDAANRVNCDIGQIVKSLVFKGTRSDIGILVLTSGSNRVDLSKISELVGEDVVIADSTFIHEKTGFSIGGIPPIGLKSKFLVFLDSDLMNYDTVWVAAGTPNSVFELNTQDLLSMTKARIESIKR